MFGQINQAPGFRQFLLRRAEKVRAEGVLICYAHNQTTPSSPDPAILAKNACPKCYLHGTSRYAPGRGNKHAAKLFNGYAGYNALADTRVRAGRPRSPIAEAICGAMPKGDLPGSSRSTASVHQRVLRFAVREWETQMQPRHR